MFLALFYTEQMGAEGLGRKPQLTPASDPRNQQTVGTVAASHEMLTL